jgi:hypothetical protein
MKKSNYIIFVLILLCTASVNICFSQLVQDTLKVLFVGNSYTYFNNLPQLVSIISDSTNTKLLTKKSVGPGAKLSEHWHGKRNLKTKEIIKNGQFDIVILQEQSMTPISQPDSFYTYGHLLCEYIKENDAKPYLFLTWARENVPQYQKDLNKAYGKLSKNNDAKLIPVGPIWEMAKKIRPNVGLFNADGSHPSKLGTFISACIFTKTLTGEMPNNLPRYYTTRDIMEETVELMYLDNLDIIFCQKIADQIIIKQDGFIFEE